MTDFKTNEYATNNNYGNTKYECIVSSPPFLIIWTQKRNVSLQVQIAVLFSECSGDDWVLKRRCQWFCKLLPPQFLPSEMEINGTDSSLNGTEANRTTSPVFIISTRYMTQW